MVRFCPDSCRYCNDPRLEPIPLGASTPTQEPIFAIEMVSAPRESQVIEYRPEPHTPRKQRENAVAGDLERIFG